MQVMNRRDVLVEQLDDFDPAERRRALQALAGEFAARHPAAGANVNMHFHSFFSYNAEGWSPSRIAWESHRQGLYAAGLCDFDVLDGLEEFLQAGLALGLRTTVNVETRAYLREYAASDINSPGEPGVTYIMGAGFARRPADGSAPARGQADLRERARQRNLALIGRINARLPQIAIDYEGDVLPLTPGGGATERHIISAYVNKVRDVFGHAEAVATFWARIIGRDVEETAVLLADVPSFEEVVRSKLAKRGGIGYEAPSAGTFPPVEDFIRWVASCEAIPMTTWLDGTSAGEKDGRAMLECMRAKGAVALNIIPDRNWNIADPKTRAVKIANLDAIVLEADAMGLPVNIGTEMNKLGLPFADDLAGEVLGRHRESFTRGAQIMVGHTMLLRYAGFSYIGAAANAEFRDVAAKNAFFARVGALPPLTADRAAQLEDMGPAKALAALREAAG